MLSFNKGVLLYDVESYNKRIIITTDHYPTEETIEKAKEFSHFMDLTYYHRGKNTINNLILKNNSLACLVFYEDKVYLSYNKKNFGFHPNMALLRLKQLSTGNNDKLIEITSLKIGDRFLDCTCGLGSDAIVASSVVGKNGKVTALEASPILFTIVNTGLKNYIHKRTDISTHMRRIEHINTDYNTYLPKLKTNSYDIIYFDPMFKNTLNNAQGLDVVRSLASYTLPDEKIIKEAQRVARRAVIIKDSVKGNLLKSLNIPIISKSRTVCYGKVNSF